MDLSWFWQGLLTNGIWWLVLLFGGAVVAFLKVKRPAWAPPVLYGLAALACLSVVYFTFTGRSVFSPAPVDTVNVEGNVKKWVSLIGYGSQSTPPPSATSDFAYQITPTGTETPLLVWRDKNKLGYLQLETVMTISPQHAAILKRITPVQAIEIMQYTESELLRRNLSFVFAGPDANRLQAITIIKGVPIDGLTESGFAYAVDDIESAQQLAKLSFVDALEKYGAAITMPQAH